MTNLSKELCEICGIKGKWFEYTTETTDGCVNLGKKRVFPDFTQPENFVKLIELKVEGLSGGGLPLMGLLNKEYWLSSRPDYIEFLYKYYIPGLAPYWQDKVKQAIRETEWRYD